EATPENPSDPILRFFSNTISVVFLGSLAHSGRASNYYLLTEKVRTLLVAHSVECLPTSTQISSVHKTNVQSSYV
ncbi:Bgt-50156, partial [Blumeria graminis f. sp. tritici]